MNYIKTDYLEFGIRRYVYALHAHYISRTKDANSFVLGAYLFGRDTHDSWVT